MGSRDLSLERTDVLALLLTILLMCPLLAAAQPTTPTCEDRLSVTEALSANKDQMLAQLVSQIRGLHKQLEALQKPQEEKKP